MTDDDVTLLTSTTEINFSPEDKASFKDAIHIIYQWRLTINVSENYLINIDAPVTKWKMHYTTVTPTTTNHALTECSHPKL